MIPLELTLTDFRSYRGPETIILRGLGRACIVGPNGSGKSTIITAILWALYGKSPLRSNGDLVRRGADSCYVELVFSAGGEKYRIIRSTKASGKGTKAELFNIANGADKLLADGVRNVGNWLEANLFLDYDSAVNASVILQGRSNRFSTMAPAERKEFLSNILGLGICDKVATLARGKAKESKARVEMLDLECERIDDRISELESARDELDEALRNLKIAEDQEKSANKALAIGRGEKEKLNLALSDIRVTEQKLSAAQKDAQELSVDLGKAQTKRTELDNIISKAEEIEASAKRYETLSKIRETMRLSKSKKLELEAELHKIESEIDRWSNDIRLETERIGETQKGLRLQIFELDDFLAKEIAIRRDMSRLIKAREAFENLRKSNSKAEILGTQINHSEKEIESERAALSAKIEEKRNSIETTETEPIENLESLLREMESQLDILPKLVEKSANMADEGQSLKEKREIGSVEMQHLEIGLKELAEKIALLQKSESPECPLCGQNLDTRHKADVLEDFSREIDMKNARVEELRAEDRLLEKQIAELRIEWKALGREIERLEELSQKRIELSGRIERARLEKAKAQGISEEIVKLEKALDTVDFAVEARKKLDELNKEYRNTRIPDDAIKAAEKRVVELAQSEFEARKIDEYKTKRESLSAEINEIEIQLARLESKREKGEEISGPIARKKILSTQIEAIEFDQSEYDNLVKEIESITPALEKVQQLHSAREKTDDLDSRIGELNRKIESASVYLKELELELRDKTKDLPDEKRIDAEIAAFETAYYEAGRIHREAAVGVSNARNLLSEFETAIIEKKQLTAKKEGIEKQARLYRMLSRAMSKNGVPSFVIASALPEIEREADRLLSLLTGDELSLKLVTSTGEKDHDTLEVHISTPSGERSYESFSGGEAFRLDFALRVALSRFLSRGDGRLATLIIDEGFGSQDEEGLALLAESLRAIEHEFDLILVVTHLESFKEGFEQVVEITKLPGEGSHAIVYS